jgi:hypothetical protein
MFKVGQQVRRNPKIWRNDNTTFTVLAIKGTTITVQRAGKTRNPFTGKLEAHLPMPYLTKELANI